LRAIHKVYGPLDILHIDAHGDLYDEYEGDKHSHACPFSRIMEEDLAKNLVQVGIRTMNSHQMEQAEKFNVQVIHMSDFDLAKIPRFQNPLYISLDMDALDPAFAPGVSHHEPGGLSTREVIAIIQAIETPILGADIVEYNPKRDINDMTAMVCAKLLREIASKMLENS
jgi:agmatinase